MPFLFFFFFPAPSSYCHDYRIGATEHSVTSNWLPRHEPEQAVRQLKRSNNTLRENNHPVARRQPSGNAKIKKTLQRRPAGLFAKGVTDHTASAQLSTDPLKLNVTKEAEKRNARVVGYSSLLLRARRSRCTSEPVIPRANFTQCTVRWRN